MTTQADWLNRSLTEARSETAGIRKAGQFADELAARYTALHRQREDLVWAERMGTGGAAPAARAAADAACQRLSDLLEDPQLHRTLDAWLECTLSAQEKGGPGNRSTDAGPRPALLGWRRSLNHYRPLSCTARSLEQELQRLESRLLVARTQAQSANGAGTPALESSATLNSRIRSSSARSERAAAWAQLRRMEHFLLDHGFLDIVRLRNALARTHGASNYFDWAVRDRDGFSPGRVADLLAELEVSTREPARQVVHGLAQGLKGDPLRASDLFAASGPPPAGPLPTTLSLKGLLRRVTDTVASLGVTLPGAQLVLDMFDHPGKYENGFMICPEPAWVDAHGCHPARIHIACHARTDSPASCTRDAATLLHELGHAAHYANSRMPAPCFGHGIRPEAAALTEAQAMLFQSLPEEPAWVAWRARIEEGAAASDQLLCEHLAAHRGRSLMTLRVMLATCLAEQALYELPDHRLTGPVVLETIRGVEQRVLQHPDGSPRPTLSVPHLLKRSTSAYYYNYLLAWMASEQCLDHFRDRDGHVLFNRRVAGDLSAACWQLGNAESLDGFLATLTGQHLSPAALVERHTRSAEELVRLHRPGLEEASARPVDTEQEPLAARYEIRHGMLSIAAGSSLATVDSALRDWIGD